jgi:hypothetical protein
MVDIVERLRSYAEDAADLGATDEAMIVSQAANEIEWLRRERDRLAAEFAKANRDILPWIEKASRLKAELDAAQDALRKAND